MSNQKSGTKINRRDFLNFTNKAGIALISAGGILSVVPSEKIFAALKGGEVDKFNEIRPIQNRSTVTSKSLKNKLIVSSTLTLKDYNYLLNPEGSFIWNLCNGRHNLNMVAETLSLKYRKAPSIVRKDVTHFINTLKSLNLIEFVN